MQLIIKKKGNWEIIRYSKNKKFTYWVVSFPYRETVLQFQDLKKAKEYFNCKIRGSLSCPVYN